MSNDDNVYKFPKPKRPTPIQIKSQDEILSDLIDAVRQPRNNDLCHDLIDLIMIELDAYGYDVKIIQGEQMKDLALILEAVRSTIARYSKKDHVLQTVSDDLFNYDGQQVTINDKVDFITYTNDTP